MKELVKEIKLTDEQFIELKEASHQMCRQTEAIEILIGQLIDKIADAKQNFWERVGEMSGTKYPDDMYLKGINLKVDWLSKSIKIHKLDDE